VTESGKIEFNTASEMLVGNLVENTGHGQYSDISYRLPFLPYMSGRCSD